MNTDRTISPDSWRGSQDLATLARHLISVPFVYGLFLPIALLDAVVSAYQAICFRLWRVPAVQRSEHLILDRHKLGYLNGPQKLNCLYCGYANGVLSYAREISARTEQYWCPIKHAVDPPAPHPRYAGFIDYKDAAEFSARALALRAAIQATDHTAVSFEAKVKAFAPELAAAPTDG